MKLKKKHIIAIVIFIIVMYFIVGFVLAQNAYKKYTKEREYWLDFRPYSPETAAQSSEKREYYKVEKSFKSFLIKQWFFIDIKEEEPKIIRNESGTTEHYKNNPIDVNSMVSIITRQASQSNFKSANVVLDKVYIHIGERTEIYYWKYYNELGANTQAFNHLQRVCYQANNQ